MNEHISWLMGHLDAFHKLRFHPPLFSPSAKSKKYGNMCFLHSTYKDYLRNQGFAYVVYPWLLSNVCWQATAETRDLCHM